MKINLNDFYEIYNKTKIRSTQGLFPSPTTLEPDRVTNCQNPVFRSPCDWKPRGEFDEKVSVLGKQFQSKFV